MTDFILAIAVGLTSKYVLLENTHNKMIFYNKKTGKKFEIKAKEIKK